MKPPSLIHPARPRHRRLTGLLRGGAGLGALLAALPLTAIAAPQGANVVRGTATVVPVDANGLMQVNQTSNRAVIHWDSFNVSSGETVKFRQPGTSSVTLNRVMAGNGTIIAGDISANGRVFLLDPRGVLVTQGATLDVNSLVLSTASTDDDAFMDGRYSFNGADARPGATIVNRGAILADQTGFVALVGANVSNFGTITAQLGTVALAAAPAFSLDFVGDGLISFDVSGALNGSSLGDLPSALVANTGTIRANGGTVHLTVSQAVRLVDNAISLGGVVEATTIDTRAGAIVLSASAGDVSVSGRISAVGDGAGEKGGTVGMRGDTVTLGAGAVVNVSGEGGGGSVKIGGDTAPVQSVDIAATATIQADGTRTGAGGNVVLSAAGSISHAGRITANGLGAGVGRGGTVAMQAGTRATIDGTVTASAQGSTAPGGWTLATGSDLLVAAKADPTRPDASFVSASAVQGALDNVTSVSLATPGDLDVTSAITRTLGTTTLRPTLDLKAGDDITLATGATLRGVTARGFNVSMAANSDAVAGDTDRQAGDVIVNAAISTFGGKFTSSGVDFTNSVGIGTSSGVIDIRHTGLVTVGNGLSTTGSAGADLTIVAGQEAGKGIRLGGPLSSTNGTISLTGPVTLAADSTLSAGAGHIIIDGTIDGARALTLNAAGRTELKGAVGGTTALASLVSDRGVSMTAGSVRTTGAQTYLDNSTSLDGSYSTSLQPFTATGTVTVASGTVINTNGGALTLGPVKGTGTLRLINVFGALTLGGVDGLSALEISSITGVGLAGGTYRMAGDAGFNFTNTRLSGDVTFRSAASLGSVSVVGETNLAGDGAAVTAGMVTGISQGLTLSGNITVVGDVETALLHVQGAGTRVSVGGAVRAITLTSGKDPLELSVTGGATITDNVNLSASTDLSTQGNWRVGWKESTFGQVTLAGDLNIQGDSGITFTGPVDGAAALTVNGKGDVIFNQAVGAQTRLTGASLTGGSLTLAGLHTVAAQTVGGAKTTLAGSYTSKAGGFTATGPAYLSGATTLDMAGDIIFNGTLDGPGGLDATTTGTARLEGDVGTHERPGALTITAAKGIELGKDVPLTVAAADKVDFAGNVLLRADTVVEAKTTTMAGTVTGLTAGAQSLVVKGDAVFKGTVGGGNAALESLTVTGGTGLGADVTTRGDQSYGTLSLLSAVTLDAGADDILFTGAVSGDHDLKATAGTITAVGMDTGGDQTLSAGTLNMSGTYRTTDDIAWTGAVKLAGTVDLNAGGTVDITGAVDADKAGGALKALAGGDLRLAAGVGADAALSSLDLTGKRVWLGTGPAARLRTTGDQTVTGPVTLASDLLLVSDGKVVLDGMVDSDAGGARVLVVNAGKDTHLTGDVGATRALAQLATDAGAGSIGAVTVSAADAAVGGGTTMLGSGADGAGVRVVTSGGQSHGDIVVLAADTSLSTAGSLNFAAALRGDGKPGRGLVANSGGNTAFMGGVSQLASLTTDAAQGSGGTLRITGAVTSGAQTFNESKSTLSGSFTGTGLNIAGATVIAGRTIIDMGTGKVDFGGTVQAADAAVDSTLQVTGGDIIFRNAVGSVEKLSSLDVTGTGIGVSNSIYTRGSLTLTGPTRLNTARVTLSIGSGDLTLAGTVKGASDLTLERSGTAGRVVFTGDVGGDGVVTSDRLLSLTTQPGMQAVLSAASIRTGGNQTWGGGVALTRDVGLHGNSVSFAQNVWSGTAQPASLSVTGQTSVTFRGDVGMAPDAAAGGALRALTVLSPRTELAPSDTSRLQVIRTVRSGTSAADGAQSYSDLVTIGGTGAVFDTTGRWQAGMTSDSLTPLFPRSGESLTGGNLLFSRMTGAEALWLLGNGNVQPTVGTAGLPQIAVRGLTVAGQGGQVLVEGTLGTQDGQGILTGNVAAQRVVKIGRRSNDYRLNDCAMGNPTCIVINYAAPPVPETVSIPAFPVAERVIRFDPTGVIRGNEDLWPERATDDKEKGTDQ